MKLHYKRILILFSVALNIGFLAMAAVNTWDRVPKDEKRWNELKGIVQELNLAREKSDKVIELMAKFRESMDAVDSDYKASRIETLDYLARVENIDQDRFHDLLQGSDRYTQKKREMFESHVMALGQLLGDTDRARLFSRLKAHYESKRRHSFNGAGPER